MQITCPQCQQSVSPANVNVQTSLAQCSACGNVFNFVAQATMSKPEIAQPKGIDIGQNYGDLVLRRSWYHPSYIALAFFCCFWDGFLVVWYSIAITQHQVIMMLFPLLHVAVGIFITYTALTGFFNATEFRINDQAIAVAHGPMWWPGNKIIPAADVTQLFCEEIVSHSRNGRSISYNVMAVMADTQRLKLASDIREPAQARYIEQEIERRLRIADRPVAGEMNAVL